MHAHLPGLSPCPGTEKSPPCGLRVYAACATCWSTHLRLHHPKRRARRVKKEATTHGR